MKCTCYVNGQDSPCPFCIALKKKWEWLTPEAAQKILAERDWEFEPRQRYTGWNYGMVGPHLPSGFVTTVKGEGFGLVDAVRNALEKEEAREQLEIDNSIENQVDYWQEQKHENKTPA